MKKVKYLLLLVLFAIITTGCVKFNATMDIKKDKSMDFSIIYAFDKTILGEGNGVKEEDLAEAKKEGYEVTKYSEGNYEGFKLVKKIANIDEISSEEDVIFDLSGIDEASEDNKYMFKVVKGSDKNTYTAKFKFTADTSSLMEEEPDDTGANEIANPDEYEGMDGTMVVPDEDISLTTDGSDLDMSALMQSMDLTFSVNLPNSALSSNATTKENDNKKLTWKLTGEGEQFIEFSFELSNKNNSDMMLYLAVGAAVVVFLILLGVLIMKKKKNNTLEIVNEETVAPSVKDVVTPVAEETITDVEDSIVPEKKDE